MQPAENQCIEWKESWKDDCLQEICAFANAQGGRLHIGRNDSGVDALSRLHRILWVDEKLHFAQCRKNARRAATLGVSSHRHSAAFRGLSRTRGCPRVAPVAIDRRSYGTRNRRLTARIIDRAEWRAGYNPAEWRGVPVGTIATGETRGQPPTPTHRGKCPTAPAGAHRLRCGKGTWPAAQRLPAGRATNGVGGEATPPNGGVDSRQRMLANHPCRHQSVRTIL